MSSHNNEVGFPGFDIFLAYSKPGGTQVGLVWQPSFDISEAINTFGIGRCIPRFQQRRSGQPRSMGYCPHMATP